MRAISQLLIYRRRLLRDKNKILMTYWNHLKGECNQTHHGTSVNFLFLIWCGVNSKIILADLDGYLRAQMHQKGKPSIREGQFFLVSYFVYQTFHGMKI